MPWDLVKTQTTFFFRLRTWGLFTASFLLILTLSRAEFLFWNYKDFALQNSADLALAFFLGWRFDISAICYLASIHFLLSCFPFSKKNWFFLCWCYFALVYFPFAVVNWVDIEFFHFVGRRFTKDGLFILSEAPDKVGGLLATYWSLFLFSSMMFVAWVLSLRHLLQKIVEKKANTDLFHQIKSFGISLAVTSVLVIGARGGLQTKPIEVMAANVFPSNAMTMLILNTPFTFLKSIQKIPLAKSKYFSDHQEVLHRLNGTMVSESDLKPVTRKLLKKNNVVILVVESLSLEYLGTIQHPLNSKTPSMTPFLDQLVQKSLFFPSGFANARRSIEGIGALISGIPAWMEEPFITSSFGANEFVGLGQIFQNNDYDTSFFHGGKNGTMHFDTFTRSAGFENYFGMNEYPNSKDFDGNWGIFDRPFLRFANEKLKESAQPFLSMIFTLSSHQPYTVPESEKANFIQGPIEVSQSLRYTDDALREFFSLVEKEPWYKDTLFVITADHTQKEFLKEFNSNLGRYQIPFIFFHPQVKLKEDYQEQVGIRIFQQIDLIPTLVDLMGLQIDKINPLGGSVFNNSKKTHDNLIQKTALSYNDGTYFFLSPPYFYEIQKEVHKDPKTSDTFHIKLFSLLENQSVFFIDPSKLPEVFLVDQQIMSGKSISVEKKENILRDLELLKAQIQYFSEGMWDRSLYYPPGK